MRGTDERSGSLFSYVDLEARVPMDHPLRPIRELVNDALARLSPEFEAMYSYTGRPSIPAERLLRALLLQAFYTIRSERQLMEQLEFNLLFRWFVGLGIDDPVWDATVFCKNRDRLLSGDVAARLLAAVVEHPRLRGLLSHEHFSVDGTLIEAWASHKSFRPKGGGNDYDGPAGRNAPRDIHGEARSNATHASTTDPDARLFRKGDRRTAQLCYIGHVLMDNRHGLAVDGRATRAYGVAERLAALDMLAARPRKTGLTVGGDKGFDARDFVMELRELGVTPHVAQNAYDSGRARRRSTIDGRTTRHPGYVASQRVRKRIEEIFGWLKTIAGQRKTRFRGLEKVGWSFTLALAAYNLIRIPRLLVEAST